MLFWALQARNVTMVELVLSKSKDIIKFKVSVDFAIERVDCRSIHVGGTEQSSS